MTIDEAIKYCEEEVEQFEKVEGYRIIHNECGAGRYVEEHRQLAEWLKELKQLRKQTQWIPVSERLPEDGKWALFTDGSNISVERYKKDAIDHFFPQERWFSFDKAIAWMPLPEPYKAESE